MLIAGAARADVLVTRDGTSLVTRGPWSVDGKVVRFHDEADALRTLRLVDVDVDASNAATAEAVKRAAADDAKGKMSAAAEGAASSPIAAAAASLKRARATGAPAVLVLHDGDVASADPAAIAAAKAGASRAQFVLYGTSWCPWCKKERQLLAFLGVSFIEKDTEHTPGADDELLRLTGTTRVPVLVRGSRVIRGFQAEAIQQLVAEARAVEQAPEPAP
ncbi:MAG TPA: glutaredoxin family protein [Thermoanaerobaculia bacterium]|jgi:glutaredoxin|nr:glutaredoxin family protein [Thermoanaerobaculia bacterium]